MKRQTAYTAIPVRLETKELLDRIAIKMQADADPCARITKLSIIHEALKAMAEAVGVGA